jgi:hypothetical protein
MHLVINQVMQFQYVHVTNGYLAVKRFASTTIVQGDLGH